jgi:hypothetical protein
MQQRAVGIVAGLAAVAAVADSGRAGVVELQAQLAELGGLPGCDWAQAFNELAAPGYVTAGLLRP